MFAIIDAATVTKGTALDEDTGSENLLNPPGVALRPGCAGTDHAEQFCPSVLSVLPKFTVRLTFQTAVGEQSPYPDRLSMPEKPAPMAMKS